jgi:hypothetical protein
MALTVQHYFAASRNIFDSLLVPLSQNKLSHLFWDEGSMNYLSQFAKFCIASQVLLFIVLSTERMLVVYTVIGHQDMMAQKSIDFHLQLFLLTQMMFSLANVDTVANKCL